MTPELGSPLAWAAQDLLTALTRLAGLLARDGLPDDPWELMVLEELLAHIREANRQLVAVARDLPGGQNGAGPPHEENTP